MATTTINWNNPTGSTSQEIYYGKASQVQNLPGTGSGWVPYSGNPITSGDPAATISGLDDNVKYKFVVRTNCVGGSGLFTETTNMKIVAPVLTLGTPVNGSISYSMTVPASLVGSDVQRIRILATGKHRLNGAVIQKSVIINTPFLSSYTGTITRVGGDVNWNFYTTYERNGSIIYKSAPQEISTDCVNDDLCFFFRNNLKEDTVADVLLDGISILGTVGITNGNSAYAELNSLVPNNPHHVGVTIAGMSNGYPMRYSHIREGITISTGSFSYAGANTLLAPSKFTILQNDIIQIAHANITGNVGRQEIVIKTFVPTNGYNIKITLDKAQTDSTSFDVKFTEYNYSISKAIERLVTLTIPAGQTTSEPVFVGTLFNHNDYLKATIIGTCISSTDDSISWPTMYSCP